MNDFQKNTKELNPLINGSKVSFLNLVKWIFGIIAAGVVSLGLAAFVMHFNQNVDMTRLSKFQYWIVYLTVPSVAFGLFVFLSCLFVPLQKKYAGILVVLLTIMLIGYGIYQHYIDNGYLPSQYPIRYTGFIAGLIIGFIVSYRVFKNKNW